MSETSIHPTAIVDSSVELGSGVSVGPFSVISGNVTLGDDVKIDSHVAIQGSTDIGEGCEIFPFASIGARPQDLKYSGEESTLEIGPRNTIREYVTMNPGTRHGRMKTTVGADNLFMASSHVAHDCLIGSNCVFANSVAIAGHVEVGSKVILGGLSGVHQFARIGDFAMISGGSMVGKDIPPFCIGQGDRAVIRGINTVGLGRSGMSDSDIKCIRQAYRHLFAKRTGLREACMSLPEELSKNPHIKLFTNFILSAERGVASSTMSEPAGAGKLSDAA